MEKHGVVPDVIDVAPAQVVEVNIIKGYFIKMLYKVFFRLLIPVEQK